MGYLYQGPPFRFSYLGLGEPLCFAAFGPLATCAFYLAQVSGHSMCGVPPGGGEPQSPGALACPCCGSCKQSSACVCFVVSLSAVVLVASTFLYSSMKPESAR